MADVDFRGRDLRGKSFRDQDLTDADFRETDLRGTDFGDARLVRAKFTDARLGVRPLVGLLILLGAMTVSVGAGFVTGIFASTIRDRATASDWREVLGGWFIVAVVVVFFGFLIRSGLRQALWASLISLGVVLAVDVVLVYLVTRGFRPRESLTMVGLLLLFGLASLAGVLGRIVGGTFGGWVTALVALPGGLAAGRASGGLAAILVSVMLVYVSKRALKLDPRDHALRQLAHRIVTRRGTRFTGADISDADFTGTLAAQSNGVFEFLV